MKTKLLLATALLSLQQPTVAFEPQVVDSQKQTSPPKTQTEKKHSRPYFYDEGARDFRYPIPVNFEYAYIDSSGKILIRGPFGHARSFSNDRAVVYFSPYEFADNKWILNLKQVGYKNWLIIDSSGTALTEPAYREISDFLDNETTAQTASLDSILIDRSGKLVRKFDKKGVAHMSEGLASFQSNSLLRGYLNASGATVISEQFNKTGPFREGLAVASQGNIPGFPGYRVNPERMSQGLGEEGFIDKTGRFVIGPKYHHAEPFLNGLAVVMQKDRWGLIDRNGEIVIPLEYDWAGDYGEELIPVERDKKVGFINKSNSTVIPFKFAYASAFSEGKAAATVDGTSWGYIDKSGEFIIEPSFLRSMPFKNGRALVYVKPEDRTEFAPEEAPYFYWSACLSRLKIDLESARASYEMAIKLAPSSEWAIKSRCFMETSMPKAKIPEEILREYGRSLKEADANKAIQNLKFCLEKQPDFPWLYAGLASFYIKEKRYDDAEKALTNVLAAHPKYSRAYYWMSILSQKRGDKKQAETYMLKAQELNPYDDLQNKSLSASPTKNE